jgi:hypothetical protein
MLAGLGDKVAQPPQHFVPHLVIGRDAVLAHYLAKQGISILAVPLEVEEEGHMVDAGHFVT